MASAAIIIWVLLPYVAANVFSKKITKTFTPFNSFVRNLRSFSFLLNSRLKCVNFLLTMAGGHCDCDVLSVRQSTFLHAC